MAARGEPYQREAAFLQRLPRLFSLEYPGRFQELESMYADKDRLPPKINFSEAENLQFDSHRIEYILKATTFITDYYSKGKSPVEDPSQLNPVELALLDGLNTLNCRRLLEHVAWTIYHLSGSVRAKYKDLLKPDPFTWETFEHLGGLMKTQDSDWLALRIRNVTDEVAKRLMQEYQATETTIEAALPSIINDDLPKLRLLFDFIQKCEAVGTDPDPGFPPVQLTAIKALTRRIVDLESLIELLSLSDNHVVELDPARQMQRLSQEVPAAAAAAAGGQLYAVQVNDADTRFSREINLSSQLARHAALRRLVRIGELITGKYLSSFIRGLDASIDWSALIIIRDVIVHQDEGTNRFPVDELLADEDGFLRVLGQGMTEFFMRLTAVVTARDAAFPKFCENPDVFWQRVYAYEKADSDTAAAEAAAGAAAVIEPRASAEDVAYVRGVMEGRAAEPVIQEELLSILEGRSEIPDRRQLGGLLRYLPKKREDKRCREIIDAAVNPRSTLAEREAMRQQMQADAAQRQAEREALLTGLNGIRELAGRFTADRAKAPLTRLMRIDMAIDALENIKRFMEEDEFIRADFNFPSLDAWGKAQDGERVHTFYARLLSSPEFNDALEYNAAQLLQHLDAISNFPEARGHRYLDREKDYEAMRCLRNWVEHGNYLQDKVEYEPGEKRSLLEKRQEVVGPIMITLIFELLPSLYRIRDQYLELRLLCQSPENPLLWSGVNCGDGPEDAAAYSINKKAGPGYGF